MKKSSFLLIILVVVHITACADDSGIKCISDGELDAPTSVLSISPKIIKKGDGFRVMFPETEFPHPKNFAIYGPEGDYSVVVDTGLPETESAMSSERFVSCRVFEINSSILKGVFWNQDGQQMSRVIFEKAGEYRLYFADNLETEASNTFAMSIEIKLADK